MVMKMTENKYVAIDLDGVIAQYDGWQGEFHIGDPKESVIEEINRLKLLGYKIIIYTCRRNIETIKEYLKNNDIPFDYINRNPEQPATAGDDKVFAHYYIDDRNPHHESLRDSVDVIEKDKLGSVCRKDETNTLGKRNKERD